MGGRRGGVGDRDHGNAEQMIEPRTGGPFTAHTTSPRCHSSLPTASRSARRLRKTARLEGPRPQRSSTFWLLPVPAEMTGRMSGMR